MYKIKKRFLWFETDHVDIFHFQALLMNNFVKQDIINE